jgi:hypothetical protein
VKEADPDASGRLIVRVTWVAATVGALILVAVVRSHDPVPSMTRLALAWRETSAAQLIRDWASNEQIEIARTSIRYDYALIVAYTVAIAGLCAFGSRRPSDETRSRLGRLITVGVVVAGAFDLLENLGMSRMLDDGSGGLALPVSLLSTAKFSLLGLGLAYGVLRSADRTAAAIEERLTRDRRTSGRLIPGVAATQVTMGKIAEPAREPVPPRPRLAVLILRWLVGLPLSQPFAPPTAAVGVPRTTGISCSGGGIRSAAYNLGALQVLQTEGVLKESRYLTAVSGGSYIAASYAMIASRSDPRPSDPYAPGTPEEHFLKTHSAYLGPAGLAGKFWLAIRLVSGMAVNFGFVVVFLFLVARPLGWWYAERLQRGLTSTAHPVVSVRPWMWLVPTIIAGAGILLVLGDLLTYPRDRAARLLRSWAIRLIDLAALAALVLILLPMAVLWMIHLRIGSVVWKPQFTLPSSGLAVMILGAARGFASKHRSLAALFVGAVVGPLVLVFTFLLYLRGAVGTGFTALQFGLWAVILVVFASLYFSADLTSWSPHPPYQRALWSAFGLRRVKSGTDSIAEVIDYNHNVKLSEVPYREGQWPELVVCAAANISDAGATPPGRNATWFNFSATEVGGPMGTVPTEEFENMLGSRNRDISLGSAVAISGAAVSPSMGKMTRAPIRFLMALMNVRLGVWLPNPWWETTVHWWSKLQHKKAFWHVVRGRPRPRFLVKELMGWNHANSKFLYVSDGGHYENLGLVELIRRGCTLIYCLDASGDHEETFHTLGEAIALARTELLVEIDIRPDPMRPPKEGRAATDFVVGTIRYPNGVQGTLVYGKATVTDEAPWDVRDFRERDPRFPNHSTIDQFFNEQKFEAYRALGAATARRMAHWADPNWNRPPSVPPTVVDLTLHGDGEGMPTKRRLLRRR